MLQTLGMAGPVAIHDLADYLDDPQRVRTSAPRGLGGSPVVLLVKELLRRGRSIKLFTLDFSVSSEVVLRGDRLSIFVGPYRKRPRYRAMDCFAVERKYLAKAMAREKPDVLHAHWTYEYALGALATGLPHVITAHDAPLNILRLFHFHPYRMVRLLMAYRVLRRARRVTAVAPYVAEHLARFHFHARPIAIVPNGMPHELFNVAVAPRENAEDVVYATVLNGWGGLKNGQVAIEAFALVRQRLPRARLVMFGTGHEPGGVGERWAQQRGLTDGIEFAGRIPYPTLMRRLAEEVDVLVHPALEEANCMAELETMALGIANIGGVRSGGVPWTLDFGKAGLLVDVTSPTAVAEAMLTLGEHAAVRVQWGQRGRASALERFHIARVADAYEELYCRALSQ